MGEEKNEVDSGENERIWYHRIRGIFGDNEAHSRRDLFLSIIYCVVFLVGLYLYTSGAVWFLESIFGG